MNNRRDFLKKLAASAFASAALPSTVAALTAGVLSPDQAAAAPPAAPATTTPSTEKKPMPFTLPALPYEPKALEPYIDARTMEIHHGKHHQAYIDNANKALADHPDLASKSVEDLLKGINTVPDSIKTIIRNHGGGHANHSLFWEIMAPGKGGDPSGDLATAVNNAFGDAAKLKELFADKAMKQFGSGWAWLVVNNGKLEIYSTPNQDSPLMSGHTPILGIDVWEHAYYLNYQNRRADYIKAWWNVVNWDKVAALFAKATK